MWRLDPLLSRGAQKLRGRQSLAEGCIRAVEASPPVHAARPRRPVYVETDLDRITASDPMATLEIQRGRLEGTTEFGPSHAYLLPPMAFVDGNFARGRLRFEANTERERLIVRSRDLPEVRGAAFVSSAYGNKFFGHFLTDDLPTAVLGAGFGAPHVVSPTPPPFEQAAPYRRVLALEHPSVWSGRAVDCWVFHDPHLNDSKVARLHELRSRIVRPPAGGGGPARRLYLTRGRAGAARAPENEAELVAALDAAGWDVLDPAVTPVSELHEAMAGAEVVAGVEGSHMAHTIYGLPDRRCVVLLMPPDRFNLWLKDFVDRLDLRLGFHVGTRTATGWTVDVSTVSKVVDQLERST